MIYLGSIAGRNMLCKGLRHTGPYHLDHNKIGHALSELGYERIHVEACSTEVQLVPPEYSRVVDLS